MHHTHQDIITKLTIILFVTKFTLDFTYTEKYQFKVQIYNVKMNR